MQAKEGNSSGVAQLGTGDNYCRCNGGSFGREENEWSFIVGDPSLNEHHLNCSLVQPAISLVQEVDGLLGF